MICVREGLGYTPYSPLAGGWLTGKYRRGEEPPRRLADDAAPGRVPPLPGRPGLRRARGVRGARPRARDFPGRARDRLAARRSERDGCGRRPAPTRAAAPGARGARPPALARRSGSSWPHSSHERARHPRARRPPAAADGRVHRSDGQRPARARAWRAAPAAPIRDAAARSRQPDGLHAGAQKRRRLDVVAEGDRDRTRQLGSWARRAPGRGSPPRRRDGRAAGDPERVADHRDPHGRRLRGRDAGARTTRRADGRDPRRRRAGTLPCRGDARRARRRRDPVVEPPGRRDRRGGAARRRRRLHVHERARADPPARVARAGHARERRRREPSDRPRARHRDDGRRAASSSTGASRR